MINLFHTYLCTIESGSGIVIATVVEASGSTPQKPGSTAIIQTGRVVAGTVGGGVAEGKVAETALACSLSGESRILRIFLNSDISNKEEAVCGGEMSVLLDANPHDHLKEFGKMQESLERREPGVLLTMVTRRESGHVSVKRYWAEGGMYQLLPSSLLEIFPEEARSLLGSGGFTSFRHLEVNLPGEEQPSLIYLEPVFPLPVLIIAGAGHIGKALSHLGKMLGFEVTVIDDREEYANKENLPDASHILVKNIGQAMASIEKRDDTYIVIVTRGHKDDGEALRQCIGSDAAFVGMIGSVAKIARMKKEFIEQKWATEEQWAEIHAPIGLDIKSKTVEEIAISIAAELIQVRNKDKR